jgi:hypothetical protein
MIVTDYNAELCTQIHKDLETRIVNAERILFGNGNSGIVRKVDRLEHAFTSLQKIQEQRNSLFLKILTPALPLIYGSIAAAIWAYIHSG